MTSSLMASRTLVLGGARSGKSAYAEQLALRLAANTGKKVIYIATARAPTGTQDHEMQARIAHHQALRNPNWQTLEVPIALGDAIQHWSSPKCIILVDCLTVWLSNLLFNGASSEDAPFYPEVGVIDLPAPFHRERQTLVEALTHAQGNVILVSNEVGMGIVPLGAISRCFVDEAGRLNQHVAQICDRVTFIAAGLPLQLKK
jgi:adenosylcobinamide kinase/adenosylcobinamide-phosphate guanylyltransferase